jgi:hypothetical protein
MTAASSVRTGPTDGIVRRRRHRAFHPGAIEPVGRSAISSRRAGADGEPALERSNAIETAALPPGNTVLTTTSSRWLAPTALQAHSRFDSKLDRAGLPR